MKKECVKCLIDFIPRYPWSKKCPRCETAKRKTVAELKIDGFKLRTPFKSMEEYKKQCERTEDIHCACGGVKLDESEVCAECL